jgi:hypothetical protein
MFLERRPLDLEVDRTPTRADEGSLLFRSVRNGDEPETATSPRRIRDSPDPGHLKESRPSISRVTVTFAPTRRTVTVPSF